MCDDGKIRSFYRVSHSAKWTNLYSSHRFTHLNRVKMFYFAQLLDNHMHNLWSYSNLRNHYGNHSPCWGSSRKGLKTLTLCDAHSEVLKITFVLLCLQEYNAVRVRVFGSATLSLKTDKQTIKMSHYTREVQTSTSFLFYRELSLAYI